MALITKNARYTDLFEWQLYNATAVGMGQNGDTYLYNNPLTVHGGVTRKEWYVVPCCPSNLSRTFADLGKYIYSFEEDNNLWIHQFISSEATVNVGIPVSVRIESELPWNGRVLIYVKSEEEREFKIHMRRPSWDFEIQPSSLRLRQDMIRVQRTMKSISRVWSPEGEILEFNFDMAIILRRAHPKVKGHKGKVALTRGPLVYCLEERG